MDLQAIGRILLIGGIAIAILGGILLLLARLPFFSQLGNLPGDIRIEGKNGSFYFPIVTSIVLSLLLTIILNIIIRLLRK